MFGLRVSRSTFAAVSLWRFVVLCGVVSDAVKRPYRSTRRAAAAATTRAAIRQAAAAFFLERGFAATSLREVAARAGVGERTVYDAFPTKAAVFDEIVGVAIVGDESDVAVVDRLEFQAALAEIDPRRAVALYGCYVVEILERAGLLIMVAVESAGADTAMRRFSDQGAAATKANAATFVASLADHGLLACDPDEATGTVFALSSPQVHQLLREHCGWSARRYHRWLEASLARLVLPAE